MQFYPKQIINTIYKCFAVIVLIQTKQIDYIKITEPLLNESTQVSQLSNGLGDITKHTITN